MIGAARAADRLLGVDLSYRHLAGVTALRRMLDAQDLGRIYAADLTFHNAYGPDKPWFTQRSRSGGGCLIDLGTHLLDLVLWLTGATDAEVRASVLLRDGRPLEDHGEAVEDFAMTQLRLDTGAEVRLTCSWFLPAGRDCVIELILYGTDGAAAIRNVEGSFYDFRAEHWRGTQSVVISEPPDEWGGRAIADWASVSPARRRSIPVLAAMPPPPGSWTGSIDPPYEDPDDHGHGGRRSHLRHRAGARSRS